MPKVDKLSGELAQEILDGVSQEEIDSQRVKDSLRDAALYLYKIDQEVKGAGKLADDISRFVRFEIMITVFISCYNVGTDSIRGGGSFIEDCLASMDFDGEVILTDDGSDDDTLRYLTADTSKKHTKIHHARNEGLRDSWREAIGLCDTKYLLRVDADIRFPSGDWVGTLVAHMENHPECGSVGLTQIVGRTLHSAGDVFKDRYRHIRKEIPEGYHRICPSVMGCFVCHRVAAIHDVNGLTGSKWVRCETEDLHVRMWKKGWQVHCLPIQFQHRHNESNGAKDGTYNCVDQSQWIDEHMWNNYEIDWAGTHGGTIEARWGKYHERR